MFNDNRYSVFDPNYNYNEKVIMKKIELKIHELRSSGAIRIPINTDYNIYFDKQIEQIILTVFRKIIVDPSTPKEFETPYIFPTNWFQHLKRTLGFKHKTKLHWKTTTIMGTWGYPNHEQQLGKAEFFIFNKILKEN